MSEMEAVWSVFKASAKENVAAEIERLTKNAPDGALARINALAFAARHKLNEDDVIAALVHATRLGLFDMSWNVLCPGCSGVLESGAALRNLDRREFYCALCAADYEPTLDELVEATFTVNPRVRRIAAHDPDGLSHTEYMRQVFWGSGLDLPEDLDTVVDHILLDTIELAPSEKAILSLTLPPEFAILFDPVTHTAVFLDVKGEPVLERRNLSFFLTDAHSANVKLDLRPGPVRIALENRSARRVLPGVWLHNEHMGELFGRRRPFLTAKRILSNQTFRDVYRNATLDPAQRFKIINLTILFTDLRGSTALYERVGDLLAFDLVRSHFAALLEAVSLEGGAVVKTIGDAVMATFPSPDKGVRAAMRMRKAMRDMNQRSGSDDLALNIGLHEGPCLAVTVDERSDYFGQAVNVASRVQGLADPASVLATRAVVANEDVAAKINDGSYRARSRNVVLRGLSETIEVYELQERDFLAA